MSSKATKHTLSLRYENTNERTEIGVDEAGRGPLFGRVYAAAVVLPLQDDEIGFNPSLLKDSKKFTSFKKLNEAYEHIKKYAVAYHVSYCDENEIDNLNIRRATHKAMHDAIKNVKNKIEHKNGNYRLKDNYLLCIDGNDFTPYTEYNIQSEQIEQYSYVCIKEGDNKYSHIAAASICAKVERDNYIADMCLKYPYLDEYYGIASNKGYGAKRHIEGIKIYGITEWHRKTFGICKNY